MCLQLYMRVRNCRYVSASVQLDECVHGMECMCVRDPSVFVENETTMSSESKVVRIWV